MTPTPYEQLIAAKGKVAELQARIDRCQHDLAWDQPTQATVRIDNSHPFDGPSTSNKEVYCLRKVGTCRHCGLIRRVVSTTPGQWQDEV